MKMSKPGRGHFHSKDCFEFCQVVSSDSESITQNFDFFDDGVMVSHTMGVLCSRGMLLLHFCSNS